MNFIPSSIKSSVTKFLPNFWTFRATKAPGNQAYQFDQQAPGRGSFIQRMRLYSGLVLMVFVTLHYINHALGNFSVEAMENMQTWRKLFWQSNPGSALLYGALILHIILAVYKILSHRSLRLPFWDWVQVILGLLIPYFLLTHIIAMRGTVQQLEIPVDYSLALGMIWPGAALAQNFLLLITWIHGCIGLHFWLRLRNWYVKYFGWIAAMVVLVPALALTGWVNAARLNRQRLIDLVSDNPDQAQEYIGTIGYIFDELIPVIETGSNVIFVLGAGLIVALIILQIVQRFKQRIKVDYGDGKIITAAPGSTILEISRTAGIAHMSVCGGRARCSTCRTLIISGGENLGAKTPAETELLNRLSAGDNIRLACQAKVNADVTLRPLVQPHDQQVVTKTGDPLGWGVEREIAILFLDIRGFSRISEKSLPYDVVFILNSFFGEMTAAVESNNGYVDKFMGDGMMALFGLATSEVEASRDAIRAAIDCEKATRNVSRILTQHLSEPIKIGIGIHVGDAVIGRIGKTSDQSTPSRLTAIGDSVNISARLEQATKEFSTPLVISTKTAELAGLKNIAQYGEKTAINVRNISRPVEIVAVSDLDILESALQ